MPAAPTLQLTSQLPTLPPPTHLNAAPRQRQVRLPGSRPEAVPQPAGQDGEELPLLCRHIPRLGARPRGPAAAGAAGGVPRCGGTGGSGPPVPGLVSGAGLAAAAARAAAAPVAARRRPAAASCPGLGTGGQGLRGHAARCKRPWQQHLWLRRADGCWGGQAGRHRRGSSRGDGRGWRCAVPQPGRQPGASWRCHVRRPPARQPGAAAVAV